MYPYKFDIELLFVNLYLSKENLQVNVVYFIFKIKNNFILMDFKA
jgi:hypothetical protein